ncbi:hypothetical protein NXS98_11955 [Fontisphaera persica]|jgi:hypothetical protein|uniref:hypothetical protein n=1 Tax=Fontisphaera persica TaxID=2974023 RepID=UPI0024BF7201|nr:hypothetical protein [Fontisphaera persica]WCJ58435.1 hypothetical protein NXS98_11955 [Fontisphaera persica]
MLSLLPGKRDCRTDFFAKPAQPFNARRPTQQILTPRATRHTRQDDSGQRNEKNIADFFERQLTKALKHVI